MRGLQQAYVAAHHPVSELPLSILQVLQQNLELLWGLRLDAKQIQDHVESVVYDHRDQKVRAKVIPPPEPDAETDSAEVKVPLRKRKRRNPLTPA